MRTLVIGTAGHIDHGKSSLVRALTGTDPDRLKEERERGITIDLGFAHVAAPSGAELSFVDVPGHERFVRNMLAGAAGIDVVLLVVAADESVMPQTREHLDICQLLDVRAGVVALTKSDLADEETRELCRLEVAELVEGTFLEDAPVIDCSSTAGTGLEELVQALEQAGEKARARRAEGPFRLPIDRVFTLKGFGTVVTGTAVEGRLAAGDEVELLPGGRRLRVRGLQVHGEAAESAHAGQRVAVNLGGIGHDELERGSVVVSAGSHVAAPMLDAELELLETAPELEDLARVRLHVGTAEVMARVRWAGGEPPAPGGSALAQLRLEAPLVAAVGDRLILRRYSPVVTIGGGRVLDPAPPRKLRRTDAERPKELRELAEALAAGDEPRLLCALVDQAGPAGVSLAELVAWTGRAAEPLREALAADERVVAAAGQSPGWVSRRRLDAAEELARERLAAFHREEPLEQGLPKPRLQPVTGLSDAGFAALLERAVAEGRMRVSRNLVALAGHEVRLSAEEQAATEAILRAHDEAGIHAPDLPEVLAGSGLTEEHAQRLVRLLLEEGRLLKLREGLLVSAEAMAGLVDDMASSHSEGEDFAVPAFKDRYQLSRKHAIPILEYLDAQGLTRRQGDGRVWRGRSRDSAEEGTAR